MTVSRALVQAVTLLNEGRIEDAAASIETALAIEPDHPDALHLRGVLAHRQGDQALALASLQRAIERSPDTAPYHVNLGNVLRAQGDVDGAEAAYRRARGLAPRDATICCNLGGLLSAHGRLGEAMAAYRDAMDRDPALREGYQGLAWCLVAAGREAELPALIRSWAAACPEDPVPAYLADPETSEDPSRLAAYFDRFAASYDSVLEALGDQGPPRLLEWVASAPVDAVLDLGCGTGRLGPGLRPLATRLVGVDLSPAMLRRAAARGCYDELECAELGAYARAHPSSYDLVVMGDVTGYLPDLVAPLRDVASALRPGGRLALTVEDSGGPGVVRGPHGRWCHGEDHVAAALAAANRRIHAWERGPLRFELGREVTGAIVVAG